VPFSRNLEDGAERRAGHRPRWMLVLTDMQRHDRPALGFIVAAAVTGVAAVLAFALVHLL
jgi:hypothetical protein